MSSLIPAGGAQVAGTVILGMIVPAGKGRVGAVASSGMHTDPMEEGYLERFMGLAIDQARLASQHHDVPVGAVIIRAGEVIATGHNRREVDQDPTAHAEILALR
ncbi:MAG: nucleoside deaminase, partial [Euzebya sp.]